VSRKSIRLNRAVKRKVKQLKTASLKPFTVEDTQNAINAISSSSAQGPDNIANIHLRHLGPNAVSAITNIFNASISTATIPDLWKKAFLKPNKPPQHPSSYRPISMLSPISKLLKKLVKLKIEPFLSQAEHQHGFRPKLSTTTALSAIADKIATGYNLEKPPARTVLLSLDLNKAFDTVPTPLLIKKLMHTELPINYIKWLANFLTGRTAKVKFQNFLSVKRNFRNGVPQGAVLSPLLFNFYVSDFPQDPSITTISYADDINILSSNPNTKLAIENLQNHIVKVEKWCQTNMLEISTSKSSATLFTPDSHQYNLNLNISLNGNQIRTTKNPKIFVVKFDQKLSFTQHIAEIGANINVKT